MSVKLILYKSKTLSNGEHPIMIRIIKERKSKYIATGYSSHKDLWDENSQEPKRNHPHYKELKILVNKMKLETEKLVYNLETESEDLSAYDIQRSIRRKKNHNGSIYAYIDSIVERMATAGQIKNASIYKDTKRNIKYFAGKKDVQFSDIDIMFLNKFEEHLKAKGKGANTIYLYLRTLRSIMNKAIKELVCSEKYYPFKNFSLARYSNIKTEKRAITKEDIKKIEALILDNDDEILARDIFLFSYYCRGMNFTDICFLKWGNIENNRLFYTRQKTKELFNIGLLDPAQRILARYKTETFDGKDSHVFPILFSHHITAKTIYNRKEKILKVVNKNLKGIASKAEITANLTTYVARHSYATILKISGISTSVISQAMGHDSERTTQVYLESFGNKILDEASKAIL